MLEMSWGTDNDNELADSAAVISAEHPFVMLVAIAERVALLQSAFEHKPFAQVSMVGMIDAVEELSNPREMNAPRFKHEASELATTWVTAVWHPEERVGMFCAEVRPAPITATSAIPVNLVNMLEYRGKFERA